MSALASTLTENARRLRAEVAETARVLAEHRQIRHYRQLLRACQAAQPYLHGIPARHNAQRMDELRELIDTLVFSVSLTQAAGGVWSDVGNFVAVPPMRMAA